jgi:DNA-binding response OmpR family regulator
MLSLRNLCSVPILNILLIEDNRVIAQQVIEFLSAHNWQIDYADNAKLGIQLASENIFDVILLDLNLPDMDGLEVCSTIKQQAQVIPPILMLTARDSFADKAAGFKHGADDYLTKPYDLRELVLRCQALARRPDLHQSTHITVGTLELKLSTKSALIEDKTCALTTIGFSILTLLAKAYPEPISRSLIIHKIWADSPPESDALKSHIYALRKALMIHPTAPQIKTVMNIGFRLEF